MLANGALAQLPLAGAPQTVVFPPGPPIVIVTATPGDFIDYIFKFPDQGAFLRDTTIPLFAPLVNGVPTGVPLLIYNPVESSQGTIPTGNSLVLPPQLANSSVALSGFWVMVTIKTNLSTLPQALTNHPNIQIVNDRTLMFNRKPSVLLTNIDVSHINIVINIFGVYVADGLSALATQILLEDGSTPLELEVGGDLLLEKPQ